MGATPETTQPTSPPPAHRRRGARKPALVLWVPSQTAFLALVRDLTTRMAEQSGFDTATGARIALAVDEAATNVIEHAYGGKGDREVEIRFDDRDGDLKIELVDTGAMVDPRAMPRVDLARYARERRTGGLGVHLMERIMDSVTFRRLARRNVCCLLKRKASPAAEKR